jgi:lipocalin
MYTLFLFRSSLIGSGFSFGDLKEAKLQNHDYEPTVRLDFFISLSLFSQNIFQSFASIQSYNKYKMYNFLFTVAIVCALFPSVYAQNGCPIVETVPNFNLTEYISAPWYVQQQAENAYSPIERNYCVMAEYAIKDNPSFWRYTVQVKNSAQNKLGVKYKAELCAYQTEGEDIGKLAVAPCFLPKFASGDYWIIAYNEDDGYALISGGQPTIQTPNGCKTGTGTNNSGLWIFTRDQVRNDTLVNGVRNIAQEKGFDISVLNDVDQTICDECEDSLDTFLVRGVERDCGWISERFTWFRCLLYANQYCPQTCGKCE